MSTRFYITGMGIVSPLGVGCRETAAALKMQRQGLSPLTLFPVAHNPALPVGQIALPDQETPLPRTHRLAVMAAGEAMQGQAGPPCAIVLGTTTGGMLRTERLLKQDCRNPEAYRFHAPHTVTRKVADHLNCRGPNLTVSTACASAITSLHLALRLVKRGTAQRVLVGGVDSLSRLTYYGFSALQLIDPQGARPFDVDRQGMSVAEAAAFILIEGASHPPAGAIGELLGSGLSCDAFHVTRPHPQGRGALEAMTAALAHAGLAPADIRFLHLHGTGTPDNDAAEARAVSDLFGAESHPPCASIKGATGHGLAAAGAVGVVAALLGFEHDFMPANAGCRNPDPHLPVTPLPAMRPGRFDNALVNAFGFGGNNGSVVMGRTVRAPLSKSIAPVPGPLKMAVKAYACRTGGGDRNATLAALNRGDTCAGLLAGNQLERTLSPKQLRRLKRLPRIVSGLAADILLCDPEPPPPDGMVFATAWGALTETYDFLTRLFAQGERFPSPTDFVGSVHNAPAGVVAMRHNITGANITTTGGVRSFEQAFQSACLCSSDERPNWLLICADEHHDQFSPLLDSHVSTAHHKPADGGGAFYLSSCCDGPETATMELLHYGRRIREKKPVDVDRRIQDEAEQISEALNRSGGPSMVAAVLVGGDPDWELLAEKQMAHFQQATGISGPYINYRHWLGNFPTVNAVAVAAALQFLDQGHIPGALAGNRADVGIDKPAIVVLNLGERITLFKLVTC